MVSKDELDEIVDGICQDVEKVRKFMKGVNKMIAKYEISNPEIEKQLIDKYYNLDEDELW